MRTVFGAIIASTLLLMYASLVAVAIMIGIGTDVLTEFTPSMSQAMTLIGGLVSALVVGELAITAPGETPVVAQLRRDSPERAYTAAKLLTWAYLSIWFVTGLAAYVVGQFFVEPGTLQQLADLGQAWLGLAIAAGYSYFGLNPQKN